MLENPHVSLPLYFFFIWPLGVAIAAGLAPSLHHTLATLVVGFGIWILVVGLLYHVAEGPDVADEE